MNELHSQHSKIGVARPERSANTWISAPTAPMSRGTSAWLELQWSAPVTMSLVEITFGSGRCGWVWEGAFLGLADIARDQGQIGQMETPRLEALAIAHEIEQPWLLGFGLNNLALAAMMEHQFQRAETCATEAAARFQTHGIRGGVVQVLITQGQIACLQSDYR